MLGFKRKNNLLRFYFYELPILPFFQYSNISHLIEII